MSITLAQARNPLHLTVHNPYTHRCCRTVQNPIAQFQITHPIQFEIQTQSQITKPM